MNLNLPEDLWNLFSQQCGPEYAESMKRFVRGLVDRMIVSSYKYGPVTPDVWITRRDFWKTLELRASRAKETKNTEFLLDMANFCAMAFCYPPTGYTFTPTDSDQSPGYVKPSGEISQANTDDATLVTWWKTRQSMKELGEG